VSIGDRAPPCSGGASRHVFRLRATTKWRIFDVRAADLQEEMTEQRFFRSVSSDEDGGYAANIAASEASNQYSAMRKRPYKVGTALQSRV
jgi:hypothetical protein